MPCTGVWNAKGKTWAMQKNSWLLSLVLLTYSNSSELSEENRSKCWQCTLHSSHWTDATEQAGPQEQKLLFLQSTHLPPILWNLSSLSMILGLNIHFFPHSMKMVAISASRKVIWICWFYWGYPCPYIVHFYSFLGTLKRNILLDLFHLARGS